MMQPRLKPCVWAFGAVFCAVLCAPKLGFKHWPHDFSRGHLTPFPLHVQGHEVDRGEAGAVPEKPRAGGKGACTGRGLCGMGEGAGSAGWGWGAAGSAGWGRARASRSGSPGGQPCAPGVQASLVLALGALGLCTPVPCAERQKGVPARPWAQPATPRRSPRPHTGHTPVSDTYVDPPHAP